MSLLWVNAAYSDASEESRENRRQRAKNWVDRQPRVPGGIEVPEHFGEHTGPGQMAHEEVPPDDHWHHIYEQSVNLKQKIHFHQPTLTPNVVHEKIDETHPDHEHHDDDWGGDEGEPGGDSAKFIKHDGDMHLLDGHHRFVQHRLQGMDSMHALVYDPEKEHFHDCEDCQHAAEYNGDGERDEDTGHFHWADCDHNDEGRH